MSWVFDHLGLVIFFVIAYSLWRKARGFLRKVGEETERRAAHPRPIANLDPEEARRMHQIQEEIRRKIAERRGGDRRAVGAPRATEETPPPLIRPAQIPPTDPFGGPTRRIFAEIERRVQAAPPAEVAERSQSMAAQLEQQQQLAAQLRALEEARASEARRLAQTTATRRAELESGAGMRAQSRGNLLSDLNDRDSLRRAFVLREVLGPPVGLHGGNY